MVVLSPSLPLLPHSQMVICMVRGALCAARFMGINSLNSAVVYSGMFLSIYLVSIYRRSFWMVHCNLIFSFCLETGS